jgi:hypothetical protein
MKATSHAITQKKKMSLTLREENRLKMFGNRLLRRKFRSKREEVAGGWRRLHNEELHNFYASQNIISFPWLHSPA